MTTAHVTAASQCRLGRGARATRASRLPSRRPAPAAQAADSLPWGTGPAEAGRRNPRTYADLRGCGGSTDLDSERLHSCPRPQRPSRSLTPTWSRTAISTCRSARARAGRRSPPPRWSRVRPRHRPSPSHGRPRSPLRASPAAELSGSALPRISETVSLERRLTRSARSQLNSQNGSRPARGSLRRARAERTRSSER